MTATTAQQFAHLEELIDHSQSGSISIVMPTHEAGPQVQQNAIRFKNLVSRAAQELADSGEKHSAIEGRLGPLREMQRNDTFWRHRTGGLAIYFSDESDAGLITIDLHQSPSEFTFISEQFFLATSVLDAVSRQAYTVLALTWEGAKLYHASASSLEPVDNKQFPVLLRDIVLPPDPEEHLQFRTQSTGSGGTMFHGQGQGEAVIESDRHRFLSEVGKRLQSLTGEQSPPLVVVGTKDVLGEFTKATKVEARHQIEMSPDSVSCSQFEERILARLESIHREQAGGNAVIEQFETALAQQRGSRNVDQIFDAANTGRVDCLLIEQRVGYAPSQMPPVALAQINKALIRTLQTGGRVVKCSDSSLGSSAMAAIYRY